MKGSLHLIKLAVGDTSIRDLQLRQKRRYIEQLSTHRNLEIAHITRNFPKRSKEILNGGSLYWIIKGFVRARQRIVEFRQAEQDEYKSCGIILHSEIVPTVPIKHRSFQGWRYIEDRDCPPDLGKGYNLDVLISVANELFSSA